MTTLTEASSFDAVYQLETTDPVTGGPGGVANRQAQQLANRTKFLLDKFSSPVNLADGSTAVTQPQLDSDTSVATTAFVKASGMQHSAPFTVAVSRALAAPESVGNLVVAYGQSGPITLTLPASTSCPNGAAISLFNAGGFDVTIARASTDAINPGTANVASVVLKPGDSMNLSLLLSAATWECYGGSAQLAYATVFGGSKVTNGYQKLPGGLILQWGATGSGPDSNGAVVSFPIAFPNACLNITASDSGAVCAAMGIGAVSPSQFHVWGRDYTGTYANYSVQWIAIGY